jgi:hypothetical protein
MSLASLDEFLSCVEVFCFIRLNFAARRGAVLRSRGEQPEPTRAPYRLGTVLFFEYSQYPIARRCSSRNTNGVRGTSTRRKRDINTRGVIGSMLVSQPHDHASNPTSLSARTPAARNADSLVSPCRFAKRRPSSPTTSGT